MKTATMMVMRLQEIPPDILAKVARYRVVKCRNCKSDCACSATSEGSLAGCDIEFVCDKCIRLSDISKGVPATPSAEEVEETARISGVPVGALEMMVAGASICISAATKNSASDN